MAMLVITRGYLQFMNQICGGTLQRLIYLQVESYHLVILHRKICQNRWFFHEHTSIFGYVRDFPVRYVQFQQMVHAHGGQYQDSQHGDHHSFDRDGIGKTLPESMFRSYDIRQEWDKHLNKLIIINTMWGPPVISWFISPVTIVINTINHSYWSYKPT